MRLRPTRSFLFAAAAVSLALAAPAFAQRVPDLPQPAVPDPQPNELLTNRGIERRLERDEKALRELRQIVLQARAQGNPVTVKDAGPDPEVEALKARVRDLEDTLRRQTGQMEEIAHNAQLAAKAAADTAETNRQLAARLDRIEQPLLAAGAAALTGASPAPGALPPPAAGGGTGGVLGTLPAAPGGGARDIQASPEPRGPQAQAPAPVSEAQAYRAARATLDSGDYVGGAEALQDFLQRYPDSPRAPEANYWLGRTLALRNMQADAAGAYARALKGWPQTTWAGDAVVRLSSSLIELKRGSDACKAIAEFDNRYRAKATTAVKNRARDVAAQAGCS